MAKGVVLVSALCFLALATIAQSQSESEVTISPFQVEGIVFCDPCRVQVQHNLTSPIEGATVRLTCANNKTGTVTFNETATTDAEGRYNIRLEGNYESDICEVNAVSSPIADCSELFEYDLDDTKFDSEANTSGGEEIRYANPVGFMTKEAVDGCKAVYEELLKDDSSNGSEISD